MSFNAICSKKKQLQRQYAFLDIDLIDHFVRSWSGNIVLIELIHYMSIIFNVLLLFFFVTAG